MRSKIDVLSLLTDPGIIAVVRAKCSDHVLHLTEALLAGGITAVEITMTTPNALALIREASQAFGARAAIGVGTVLDAAACHEAVTAGAEFVVSPIMRPEIVQAAHAAHRPVMLGAYTPTEAQLAHEAGADFIKIFPADALGPQYVKGLRGPLPHLRIVPTGGVDLRNVADFIKAGCPAVGVGTSLINQKLFNDCNWAELTRLAWEYAQAAREAKAG